jgi:hypothetical protein
MNAIEATLAIDAFERPREAENAADAQIRLLRILARAAVERLSQQHALEKLAHRSTISKK